MPEEARKKYRRAASTAESDWEAAAAEGVAASLPAFWTVEVDRGREQEKSYILTSGDPERPEKDKQVAARLALRTGRASISAKAASKHSPIG